VVARHHQHPAHLGPQGGEPFDRGAYFRGAYVPGVGQVAGDDHHQRLGVGLVGQPAGGAAGVGPGHRIVLAAPRHVVVFGAQVQVAELDHTHGTRVGRLSKRRVRPDRPRRVW